MLTIQPQRVHFDLLQTRQHGLLEIDGPSLEECVPLGFKFTQNYNEANECLQICKELPLDKGLLFHGNSKGEFSFHVESPAYEIDLIGIDPNGRIKQIEKCFSKTNPEFKFHNCQFLLVLKSGIAKILGIDSDGSSTVEVTFFQEKLN